MAEATCYIPATTSDTTLFSSPTAATTRKEKKLASFYFSPGKERLKPTGGSGNMGCEHLFNFRLDLSLTQQILSSHHSDIDQTNPGGGAWHPPGLKDLGTTGCGSRWGGEGEFHPGIIPRQVPCCGSRPAGWGSKGAVLTCSEPERAGRPATNHSDPPEV